LDQPLPANGPVEALSPFGGIVSRLERELAFWIQFAEIWKDLAEICEDPVRRAECLQRAKVCLSRATVIRERMAKSAGSQEDDESGGLKTSSAAS
jgi:hypothetical protein